ncbi:MAG: GvpL/GvpF family gas vesicle protein [Thermoanaerobaculia bacterium]|nr:GvpL/GvpF family gas vesicle protein [Thermoanaerobaculia bacterium]
MRGVVIGAHLERDDLEAPAFAIPIGDLFLSAFPIAPDQPLGDRDLLIRVAAVRAQLLDRATFIAIRYGFAVTSPEEAHAKVASQIERWKRLLEEHRGRVEMTLKVPASLPSAHPNRADFSTGASYLKALHTAVRAAGADPEFRLLVEKELIPLAHQHRWIPRDEKSLELALLIDRRNVAGMLAAGEKLRGSGAAFLLSGPWPLEVFADDHE